MASEVDPFLGDVRETFGRVAYSHKTHEKEAEDAVRLSRSLRAGNVVVTGVTVVGTILSPLLASAVAAWVAAGAAIVGLVFVLIQLSYDPAESIAGHRAAAKAYLSIRNRLAQLIADVMDRPDNRLEHERRRDDLAAALDQVESLAPQTSAKGYQRARRALIEGGELSFAPEELDHLLPEALRVTQPRGDASGDS